MVAKEPTSLTLLERARARDQEAWQRLIYLYAPLLDHWCRRWGVQGADAEDVRQDVFQAVAAGLDSFRRDRQGDTFRGWLRGITHHKLLDLYRRRQNQPVAEGGTDVHLRMLQVAESQPVADEPEEQVTGLYHRALELVRGEFEERTWQAFWRTTVEGRSPREVADELGVTPAGVRKAKSRILHRLREEAGDLIE
jgi:RNA polymerase sigma-70 factor (ECF subfamily)